jgi:hypothetical protein
MDRGGPSSRFDAGSAHDRLFRRRVHRPAVTHRFADSEHQAVADGITPGRDALAEQPPGDLDAVGHRLGIRDAGGVSESDRVIQSDRVTHYH